MSLTARSTHVMSKSRSGLSLIELLIVMGIMTLLAAVTLPTFRTVMNQRKTSQAAIVVRNMLEAARARAVAQGRPVAVVLERLSSRAGRDTTGSLVSLTASSTDFASNFSVYNTSIRLSLAEVPPPAMFDNIAFSLVGPVLTISPVPADERLRRLLTIGAEIEFVEAPGMGRRLRVEEVAFSGGSVDMVVNNFGEPNLPFASTTDPAAYSLTSRMGKRNVFLPRLPDFATTPAGTRMLVYSLPQPISSLVVDMPRGTCVDLSLSGLASDSDIVLRNATIQNLRDLRRLFASDWSYADKSTPPAPAQLRPVYLIFSPKGLLSSVMSNDFNGLNGDFQIREYTTLEDVYLFVGRSDQVVESESGIADDFNPIDLETNREKANLVDPSCNWIRISPSSGAISLANVAPFDSPPFDQLTLFGNNPATPIGQLLYQSRQSSFTDEATAQ